MSDSDSLSEYPSDFEYIPRSPNNGSTALELDSGIESNDGYLTDERTEHYIRNIGSNRNRRILRKKLRQYFRRN